MPLGSEEGCAIIQTLQHEEAQFQCSILEQCSPRWGVITMAVAVNCLTVLHV